MGKERNLKPAAFAIIGAGLVLLLLISVYMLSPVRKERVQQRVFEQAQEKQEEKTVLGESRADSISIPGFGAMNIPANTAEVETDLYNPEENRCYFQVAIILTDAKKQIYRSDLIQPGQHLYKIKLNEGMPEGTYEAILHYDTFSMNDYTPLNGANVPFVLNVN